ncbi:hypothetical protein WA026_011025 [Henosepilachna vigintioctopunctata]|uniref:Ankyrin repeat and MYND domain-containing protein 1 n=1 Tax=Henosepilachna vigintioctopunctata TaxID=420089 RepID=A0AAW1UYG9_9CUCU
MPSTSRSCDSCSVCLDSNFDDCQNIKYNYIGDVDEDGLRNKYGYQIWNGRYKHEYAGNFLFNNMHDKGFYFIRKENSFSFYDGQFYNNKLEGYGQVIHDDGSVYEGLFKDNKRFGPGILTYTDGSQDVGFWNGNGLLRLSISVSSEFIPTLCSSSFSKVKLLRFKTIVPALPEKHDQAKAMMLKLGAAESFFDTYPQLYNYYVRNEHSLFFDSRYYDLAQLGSEAALIDVLEDESLLSMNINDTMTEYDDPCLCVNERCVHINRLIDEINFELEKIQNDIVRLKKKLRTCVDCCATEELDSEAASVEKDEIKKNDFWSANVGDPYRVIAADADISSKFKVEKDWNQMRLQSSLVDMNEVNNEVSVLNDANKGEEEKVPASEAESEQAVESTKSADGDEGPDRKITCECTERHIPDVDFIISELEDLEKNEKFHEVILQYLQNILYKEMKGTVNVDTPKTLQVIVEHLLSWNNDQTVIDMMQHCFRYRNFENMLNFSVKSLLSGNRSIFGEMGKQEKMCINFLRHCGLNQLTEVRDDLMRYNIHPDLSDARGNRGIHFAVTNNCFDVIKQLANSGANLDAFNDECLTPLLLGILRYIAAINSVTSWESAFLPEVVLNSDELEEVIHWRPHESLVNLREFLSSSCHLISTDQFTTKLDNKSLNDISIRSKLGLPSRKGSSAKMNMSYLFSTMFIEDYIKYQKLSASKKTNELDKDQLGPIENTIYILLQLGADPNVGELPMCPVLLSIFTKDVNLVEMLLEKGANPNVVNEDGLYALHILACLPFSSENVNISEKFLEHSCDPNKKTAPDFWSEQNDELFGEDSDEIQLQGKTALQLICMRKDFDTDNIEHQCALVRMLIENGAVCHHYYLGHTLLSLAVLRENVRLIETLYPYVEGTKPLGYNMGNILTITGLKRFSSAKPFVKCKEVIDTLIFLGMNPFDPVYAFPNAFEFFAKEHGEDVIENNRKIRRKLETEYKKLSKKFTSRDVVKNPDKVTVAYIREAGRKILSGIYQYKAIKHLMVLAEEDNLNNNHAKSRAKLLTVEDAIKYIKIFIHHENIEVNDPFKNLLLKVLEYVRVCNPPPKPKKKRKKKKAAKPPLNLRDEIEKFSEYDEDILVQLARFALDLNQEKYEVCYHCLKKSKKKLVVCPLCGIGKFCSALCNKFNKKTKSKHPCKILFYNNPNSKKFEFVEFSNNNTKEGSIARGRRTTLDPQKQKYEKLISKKSRTSTTSSTATTKEEDNQNNEVKFDRCCVTKNSVFFLCEENEYWKSVKRDCGFLCNRGVTEGEADTEGNSEFCVCYVPTEEHSPPKKNEDLSNNEELMKGSLAEEKQKKVNQSTNQDVITENFNNFLKRFKKKPINDFHLENNQTTEHKTQDIQNFGSQIKKHSIANDGRKGVLTSSKRLNQKEVQDQTKFKIGRGKFNSKSTEPSGSVRHTSEPLNRINMHRYKKNDQRGKHSKNDEKILPGEELRNVDDERNTSHAFLSNNRRKQQKYDHESKRSSANKSGTQTEAANNTKNDINTKMNMAQNKEMKAIYTNSRQIVNEDKSEAGDTTNTEFRRKNDVNKKKNADDIMINRKLDSNTRDHEEYSSVENNGMIKNKRQKSSVKEKKKYEPAGDSEKPETINMNNKESRSEFKKRNENKEFTEIDVNVHYNKKKTTRENKSEKSPGRLAAGKEDIGRNSYKVLKEYIERPMNKEIGTDKKESTRGLQSRDTLKKEQASDIVNDDIKENKIIHDWIKSKGFSPRKPKKETNVSNKWHPSNQLVEKKVPVPDGQTSSYKSNLSKFQKFPKLHQYFLELLAHYFPQFNLNGLLFPFACFVDGQLYYKFAESSPYYCRTYSTV